MNDLKASGWVVEHSGGGVFNARKSFQSRSGEAVGVVVGLDWASAYLDSDGRFLRVDELDPWGEPDGEVLLVTPDGPTPEGAEVFEPGVLQEIQAALEAVSAY